MNFAQIVRLTSILVLLSNAILASLFAEDGFERLRIVSHKFGFSEGGYRHRVESIGRLESSKENKEMF